MTKLLIVNADDYGRSPGVSRGIVDAHRKGIVTSTTVMVNQPGVETQLAGALGCPRLGLGIHLVFSAWKPVLPRASVPGLVDRKGFFLDQHTLWAAAETIPLEQLAAELRVQIDRFVDLTGRLPDHLDCHHFVYLYPPFFQVYADLAAELALPLRVPFPVESEFRSALRTLSFLEGFPEDLVRGMVATNSALLRARALLHPDRFVGAFFGRAALTTGFLDAFLAGLRPGITELMCHPGYVDAGLATSGYRAEREEELRLLTDPSVLRAVERHGIELTTFASLTDAL